MDLVLFCVKSYDTEASASKLFSILGPETAVLSLQNGIDNEEKIQEIIGKERVIGGVAYLSSRISRPGVIQATGGLRKIVLGEMDGSMTERAKEIQKVFESSNIACEVSTEIMKVLWEKFLFICGMGGMTAVTRMPIGPIRQFPPALEMGMAVMREVVEVGKALSIQFDQDIVEKNISLIQGFPDTARSSLLVDLEMGRRLEIDALNGTVVRLGEEHAIPTPSNRFVYACLKLHDLEVEKGNLFCPECNWRPSAEAHYCPICGTPLEEEMEEALEERIPCADESCIGIIGASGRCGTCGRKPEDMVSE